MTTLFTPDDTIDPNKDYLSEYVGEDKTFKSAADLAKGKAEADAFIERLKAENAGLRTDLKTRLRLEEVVEKMATGAPKPPSSEPEPKAPEQGNDKPITPDVIKQMVSEVLAQGQQASTAQQNTQFCEQKLQEAFGPTYKRTVQEQAKRLNLGEQFLTNLMAQQPNAFLKLFDVTPKVAPPQVAQGAPRSSVNDSFGFTPNMSGEKRKSYYDDLRRKNPSHYWTPAVQNEIHKEAHRQGESFFDT